MVFFSSAGNVSNIVRHVKVPIIHNDMCNELYGAISDKVSLHISDDMLCAGYKEGGRDACQVSGRVGWCIGYACKVYRGGRQDAMMSPVCG